MVAVSGRGVGGGGARSVTKLIKCQIIDAFVGVFVVTFICFYYLSLLLLLLFLLLLLKFVYKYKICLWFKILLMLLLLLL